ncbi:hypothetical protein J7E79_30545 [Bacillus sp. ISL-40]|uniref:hypothetical protein n=1 Tax=unclassified Bacillus (in: firmicutes) TaxID=185979 RepID=UPI001BE8355A|nr:MULTISPECIES: hypothetical protein [unclassified Bacillus (in: firmicutes)]MBT2701590.1 hypothetical protein [Bacillus sp. ISL-40]MBT2744707.1 hypothetical protein [Bacillus sp. ISL-77]
MTVLIAIAARPNTGEVPFILMGSDSLEINLDKNLTEIGRNEDAEKIYKINDKLVSVSGRLDPGFISSFLQFLDENDCELSKLYKLAYQYVYEHIVNVEIHADAKCAIYIGCCNNSTPELVDIRIKKNDLSNTVCTYEVAETNGQFIAKMAGSITVPNDDDLFDAFKSRVEERCQTLSLICVRRAAEEYLKKAAARYPDTCNQIIKFERLR